MTMYSEVLALEIDWCRPVSVQNLTPLGQALVPHQPPFVARLLLLE